MLRGIVHDDEARRRLPPPCTGLSAMFFGPENDGRKEEGRREREEVAVSICMGCEYRMPCLEKSIVLDEDKGVWGGMTEGERRKFKRHLRDEGYINEVPEGDEFWATLNAYYRRTDQQQAS